MRYRFPFLVVPMEGLEPPFTYENQILSLARLPFRHICPGNNHIVIAAILLPDMITQTQASNSLKLFTIWTLSFNEVTPCGVI